MTTSVKTFNLNDLVFETPKDFEMNHMKFKKVKIATQKQDSLIFETDECFSWGIQKSDEKFGKNKFTFPIVLKNKDNDGNLNPTEYQNTFLKAFDSVVEKCKDYCLENKDLLEKYNLEKRDLKNIANCLFVRKEVKNKRKVPVKNYPPTLYAKLNYNKKTKKITTPFYTRKSNEIPLDDWNSTAYQINPKKLENQKCLVKAAILFDSLFVSSQGIYLQIKVYEAMVRILEKEFKNAMVKNVSKYELEEEEETETETESELETETKSE